jgi:arylsulfatase A-like enzyme
MTGMMRSWKSLAVSALLLLAAWPGCSGRVPPEDANVIIILVDTLRRDRLGAHGYLKDVSPYMDLLADEGFCFRRAVAPCSWTKPSVASLLTGLYPGQHGALGDHVVLKNMAFLDTKFTTLAERMKRAGYRTGAFVTNANIISRYHFDQGFDNFTQPAGDAKELFGKASRWIKKHGEKGKFFLYLHLIDPHEPYLPPPEYQERFVHGEPGEKAPFTEHGRPKEIVEWLEQYTRRKAGTEGGKFEFDYEPLLGELKERLSDILPDVTREKIRSYIDVNFRSLEDPELLRRAEYLTALYDGEVSYTDDAIRDFVTELKHDDVLDETVLVVTSDHGEAFLEHNRWGHRQYVHAEEIDIPLIFRIPGPDGIPLKGEIDDYVSLVDLYPTLLDMLDLPAPGNVDGISLWPVMQGGGGTMLANRPVFCESTFEDGDHVSAMMGKSKVIRSAGKNSVRWIYYDLEKDPGENEPLDPTRAGEEARALMQSVESLLNRRKLDFNKKVEIGTPSDEEIEQLQELGYL